MKRSGTTIYLAPLRGITDFVFRNTYARHFQGLSVAIGPFLSTIGGNSIKPTHIRDVLPANNKIMPVIPQILSKTATKFILLAEALADLGCNQVNWNLGCPFPRVVKKGRGAGLLPFADKIDAFLDRVFCNLPSGMKLSVKTRLGRFTVAEIDALIPVFNRYSLESIIIHPRTALQMYNGCVDLDSFRRTALKLKHNVIYNGDIFSIDDFCALQRRLNGQKVWMIGRGAVRNPFMVEEIYGHCFSDVQKIQRLKAFHDDLFSGYRDILSGPGHLLNKMKGLWSYFAQPILNGRSLLKRIHKIQNLEEYIVHVESLFGSNLGWKQNASSWVEGL